MNTVLSLYLVTITIMLRYSIGHRLKPTPGLPMDHVHSTSQSALVSEPPKIYFTSVYYGFVDFITTVKNTVIIFLPSASASCDTHKLTGSVAIKTPAIYAGTQYTSAKHDHNSEEGDDNLEPTTHGSISSETKHQDTTQMKHSSLKITVPLKTSTQMLLPQNSEFFMSKYSNKPATDSRRTTPRQDKVSSMIKKEIIASLHSSFDDPLLSEAINTVVDERNVIDDTWRRHLHEKRLESISASTTRTTAETQPKYLSDIEGCSDTLCSSYVNGFPKLSTKYRRQFLTTNILNDNRAPFSKTHKTAKHDKIGNVPKERATFSGGLFRTIFYENTLLTPLWHSTVPIKSVPMARSEKTAVAIVLDASGTRRRLVPTETRVQLTHTVDFRRRVNSSAFMNIGRNKSPSQSRSTIATRMFRRPFDSTRLTKPHARPRSEYLRQPLRSSLTFEPVVAVQKRPLRKALTDSAKDDNFPLVKSQLRLPVIGLREHFRQVGVTVELTRTRPSQLFSGAYQNRPTLLPLQVLFDTSTARKAGTFVRRRTHFLSQ